MAKLKLEDAIVAAVVGELARTGVAALRKIQRIVERENRDIGLLTSITPAVGDAEVVLFLDARNGFAVEVEINLGDSPRAWLADVRNAIKNQRASMADRRRSPSDN